MADVVGTAFVRIKALTDKLNKDIEQQVTKGLKSANLDKVAKSEGEAFGEEFGDGIGDGAEKTLKKRAKNIVPEDDITDGFKNTFKGVRDEINQLDLFSNVQEQFDQIDLFTDKQIDVPIGFDTTAADRERTAFLDKTRAAFGTLGGESGEAFSEDLVDSLDLAREAFESLGRDIRGDFGDEVSAGAREIGSDFGDEVSDGAEETIKRRFNNIVPEDDFRDGLRGTIRGIRADFSQLDIFDDVQEKFDQIDLFSDADFDIPDIDTSDFDDALDKTSARVKSLGNDNNDLGTTLDKLSKKFKSIGKDAVPSLGLLKVGLLAIGGAIVAALPYIQDVGAAVLAYATGLVAQIGFLATGLVGVGAAAGAAIGSTAVAILPLVLAFKSQTEALVDFKDGLKASGEEFLRIGTATQATLLPALDSSVQTLEKLVPTLSEFGFFVGRSAGEFARLASSTLTGNIAQGRFQEILQSSLRILDKLFPTILNLGNILSGIWVAALPASERFAGALSDMVSRWSELINVGLRTGTLTEKLDLWYDRAQLIGSALGNVAGALFDILEIGANSSSDLFTRFDEWAKRYRDFTESEAGQNRIALIFDNALAVMREINGVAADLFDGIFGRLGEVGGVDSLVASLQKFRDVLPQIQEGWSKAYDAIKQVVEIIGENFLEKAKKAVEELSEPLGRLTTQFLELLEVMNNSGAFAVFLELMKILSDTLAVLLSIPGFGQFIAYTLAFVSAAKVARVVLGPFSLVLGSLTGVISQLIAINAAGKLAGVGVGLERLAVGAKAVQATNAAAKLTEIGTSAGGAVTKAGGIAKLITGVSTGLRFLGPYGIAASIGVAAVGSAFFINQKRAQQWEQEIRQVTDALGLLNGGLNITAEGITKYINETSRFEANDQLDDLAKIGFSVEELSAAVANGTSTYASFTDAALKAGQVQVFEGAGRGAVETEIDSIKDLRDQYGLTDEQIQTLSTTKQVALTAEQGGQRLILQGNNSLLTSYKELNKVIGAAARENAGAFAANEQNIRLFGKEKLNNVVGSLVNNDDDEEVGQTQIRIQAQLEDAARKSIGTITNLTKATRDQIRADSLRADGTVDVIKQEQLLTDASKKQNLEIIESLKRFTGERFGSKFGEAKLAVFEFSEAVETAAASGKKFAVGDGINEIVQKFPELTTATSNLFKQLQQLPEADFKDAALALGTDADTLKKAIEGAEQAIIKLQETAVSKLPSIGGLLDEATETKADGSQFFDSKGFKKSIDDRISDTAAFAGNITKIKNEVSTEAAILATEQGPKAAADLAKITGADADALAASIATMEQTEILLKAQIEKELGPGIRSSYAKEAGVIGNTFGATLAGGLKSEETAAAIETAGVETLNRIKSVFTGKFEIVDGVLRFIANTTKSLGKKISLGRAEFRSQGGFVGGTSFGSPFGSGPKGTDTVPAWLTPGEFVLRQSIASAIPPNTLNALNAGDPRILGLLTALNSNRPGAAGPQSAAAPGGPGAASGGGGGLVIQQMNIEAPEPLESARQVTSRLKIFQAQLARR